jgi:hypothetical protein
MSETRLFSRAYYRVVTPEEAAQIPQFWSTVEQHAVFQGSDGTLYAVRSVEENEFRALYAKNPNLTGPGVLPNWPWEPTVALEPLPYSVVQPEQKKFYVAE